VTDHSSDSFPGFPTPHIQTFVGIEFFPFDPKIEDIDVRDVAHALSMKCRYTGHCDRFYSVAEHSVLMSRYAEMDGRSVEIQRWALMHDATETYLPDVAAPLKAHIPGWFSTEDRLMEAVAFRFDLSWPMPEEIKSFDRLLLVREWERLMDRTSWFDPTVWATVTNDDRARLQIDCWEPSRAEFEFARRFAELWEEPWPIR
jgi:5'-deoxynucleotidase YfbR-like HD superfamily hydrolase